MLKTQEEMIISQLIHDESFCRRTLPYLKSEYFHQPHERIVFESVNEFVGKYNARPSLDALAVMVSQKCDVHEGVQSSIEEMLPRMDRAPNNTEFMVNEAEKWAMNQALYNATMKTIDIINPTDGNSKGSIDLTKHAIPELFAEALGVRFDCRVGHSYFESAEEQWEYYTKVENKIPFKQNILNRITRGGVTKKTLNCICAGIGVGKTTGLIDMASHYLESGLNGVYFTLEVAENVIRERTDVRMMGVNFDQLRSLERTQYMNRINTLKSKTQGDLIIKEFPAGAAHVGHFRHVIREIESKRGIKIDFIMVDYLTLTASSRLKSEVRASTNTYFTSVAEELRGLGIEFDVPVWTALQFGRQGQNAEDVTLEDIALAIGIAATADFMVAYLMPEELAPLKRAIGKVLKNRYANKSNITRFKIGLDNDLQAYTDIDDNEQRDVMDEREAAEFKAAPAIPHTAGVNKAAAAGSVQGWAMAPTTTQTPTDDPLAAFASLMGSKPQ